MSTGIHAHVQTQEHLYSNPAHDKQDKLNKGHSVQSLPSSHTNGVHVNQLTQILHLLLPKLLQESSHNNKALAQSKPETQTTSTQSLSLDPAIISEESSETEANEESQENEESSDIEESSDRDDNGDSDEGDDNDRNNRDISKCSKICDVEGFKVTVIEYFKGSCPVGWEPVE